MSRIKICIFTPFYIPGFKGGGPIKSIANLVDNLCDTFDFWIITSDRDLGDATPYNGVQLNKWVTVGCAQVFYASKNNLTIFGLAKVTRSTHCDVIYINGLFNPNFSIKPMLLSVLGFFKEVPIVLAPRGELSLGALQIKSFKKRIFLSLVKLFGIYKSINWQATTQLEKKDIIRTFGLKNNPVFIAKNLPSKVESIKVSEEKTLHSKKPLQLVFLSRISPKKNLDFALNVLQQVNVPVCFDIFGPKEDLAYWLKCCKSIERLPNNIYVNYCGVVNPIDVGRIFTKYDIFFFPTRGENYGHVIAEALSVGTSVLLSDQTPWRNLRYDGLGWDFPLDEKDSFISAIEETYRLTNSERNDMRKIVFESSYKRIFNPEDLEANKDIFLKALSR